MFALLLCVAPHISVAEPSMSYLDNGTIKVGVDRTLGGAITYLSRVRDPQNVVNNWDWGRQIQMSYYSGPTPFVPAGKTLAPEWRHLGWNPVQAGDHFKNPSKTLQLTNDGRTIFVKSTPMQWPLDGVPSECTFETWLTLKGNCVNVRSRMTNARGDKTQYPARMQELPAVYTNAPYHRLMTYTGTEPFRRGELKRIEYVPKKDHPWTSWLATEHWAALVDDTGFGLGVSHPGCVSFSGGFAGKPGTGGTKDAPTGYLAPNRIEVIDHNIVHEFEYVLILDDLENIRREVYRRAGKLRPPTWDFATDRQHWHFVNATDGGWPIKGELDLSLATDDPQLISPVGFWLAEDAPVLKIEAAFTTRDTSAQVFWSTHANPGFAEARSHTFPIVGDGTMRTYSVPLGEHNDYKGGITGLRIDPARGGRAGERVRVKTIEVGR
jgi:hypothetical protein